MKIRLYNSATNNKEIFVPQDAKRVTMYGCGPTVYNYAHIGNARAAIVTDVLFRVLRHVYGEDSVLYARNITDIDDKIINKSVETGVSIKQITEKYTKIYQDDLTKLGCLEPTYQPKATDNIQNMIDMIKGLVETDYAYVKDGHVFFDVTKYDSYGKLSGNTLSKLRKGSRVSDSTTDIKKNVEDFVLWKPEKDGVGWISPFGKGRVGWHIECSAMAKATLGETIDIHTGGIDLKFPHHENERAQSECANGKTFAKYWIHNEFLKIGGDKMSKSLGNTVYIHDLLKDWDGKVIRLALLKSYYRFETTWSFDSLKQSEKTLRRLLTRMNDNAPKIFDDLNTPAALAGKSSTDIKLMGLT